MGDGTSFTIGKIFATIVKPDSNKDRYLSRPGLLTIQKSKNVICDRFILLPSHSFSAGFIIKC